MSRSKSWSWKETAVDVQVQHCFSQQLPLFYWFFLVFFCFTFITVILQSAQTHKPRALCVLVRECVCVCTQILTPTPPPAAADFLSAVSSSCLSSLISEWMNAQPSVQLSQSHSCCVCICVWMCVCAFHSCRRISRRLFMCFSSCLDPTGAPEWLTHPALSRLQCFHLFGDMVGVFVLLCFYPLASQCAQTGSQDCRRLCV